MIISIYNLLSFLVEKKKLLKIGSLPTLNMPTKSHPSSESKTAPRREIVKVVVVDEGPRGCIKQKATYKDFDVCRKAKKVNLKDWKLTETKEDRIIFVKKESPYSMPTFKIIIDDSSWFFYFCIWLVITRNTRLVYG